MNEKWTLYFVDPTGKLAAEIHGVDPTSKPGMVVVLENLKLTNVRDPWYTRGGIEKQQ